MVYYYAFGQIQILAELTLTGRLSQICDIE